MEQRMSDTKYMSATEAYKAAQRAVQYFAGELGRNSTPTQLRRLADDMDMLADVFDRRPETWTAETFFDPHARKVCSVGMLYPKFRNKAKLKGLKLKKVTRRTDNKVSAHDDGLNSFLIEINDARLSGRYDDVLFLGPKNAARIYKVLAPAVRKLADLRAKGGPLKTEVVKATLNGPLRAAENKASWYSTHKKIAA